MQKDYWWKDIFNEIYLSSFISLYTSRQTKQEVNFIIKILKLENKNHILDVACGNGRHSIELASRGFFVTGIDYSDVLLREAKKQAKKLKIKINFLRQDIRKLKLNKKFEAAIMLGNSFGYFNDTDNRKVIKNISAVLKKDSIFILDLPNTEGMLRNIKKRSKRKIPKGYIITENLSYNPKTSILKLCWIIVSDKKKYEFKGAIRLYTLSEITSILNKYKMKVDFVYGSFKSEPYNIKTPRMIIVAKKN